MYEQQKLVLKCFFSISDPLVLHPFHVVPIFCPDSPFPPIKAVVTKVYAVRQYKHKLIPSCFLNRFGLIDGKNYIKSAFFFNDFKSLLEKKCVNLQNRDGHQKT